MNFLKKVFKRAEQFEFIPDRNGLHHLGGDVPADFRVPPNNFLGGLQYVGYINNADQHFEWLPFPLHIICPIFTDFDYLFLDYENPNEPAILYPPNSKDVTSAYDELTRDSYVIYHKADLSLQAIAGISEDHQFEVIGVAGIPHWTQASEAPTCPRSGKKMKFVCQFMSNGHITAKEKNFHGSNDYYEELFMKLNFWCDGDLKLFFEPTSGIACCFIQNT